MRYQIGFPYFAPLDLLRMFFAQFRTENKNLKIFEIKYVLEFFTLMTKTEIEYNKAVEPGQIAPDTPSG